jgi:hypothetical protein
MRVRLGSGTGDTRKETRSLEVRINAMNASSPRTNFCRLLKGEPAGYLEWIVWAEQKSKTHRQVRCREHGLFHKWVRRTAK